MGKSNAQKALEKNNPNFLIDVQFCENYYKAAVEHFQNAKHPLETRYNSWDQCYKYFRGLWDGGHRSPDSLSGDEIEEASLRLAFYMASWGMYRGSSFLLQNDHTIYKGIVCALFDAKYTILWELDYEINNLQPTQLNTFLIHASEAFEELCQEINNHFLRYKRYQKTKSFFTQYKSVGFVSKTVITKLILGTIGCYPALDRFFSDAFGTCGSDIRDSNGNIDKNRIKVVFRLAYYIKKNINPTFVCQNATTLNNYPIMKLIDMYYFGKGLEAPFLNLLSQLKIGTKTLNTLKNEEMKLFKIFLLAPNLPRARGMTINLTSGNSCVLDIAFPCINIKPTNCPLCNTGSMSSPSCVICKKSESCNLWDGIEMNQLIEETISSVGQQISNLSDDEEG